MWLKDWMTREGLSDAEMAGRIGEISAEGVRKLRFRTRGPSIRVAARIEAVTAGAVRAVDLEPVTRPVRVAEVSA
ncbi:hypothetical protein [Methylorubrum extorquens]|jgi:hypothetical protein|uniref:XRE family transcriptional regulator n=1 Tax=Methylorubrum extorquens DSM 13060 TaxID=882800 RepID=H1KNR3_METEX|nr:hypothetical protein [Methylorubrum extorquens]EHP90835.1 hypothetical protein MetexDRAFT_4276 [Methylorubrum extorquens DSM 13060]